MRLVAAVAGAVLVLDQVTKAVVLASFLPGTRAVLVPGVLDLVLVLNPGIAFGLLGGLGAASRWLAVGLAGAALVGVAWIARGELVARRRVDLVAIGLVAGGAVGNLVDRARFGAVVDFVDLHWGAWHWPAFNAADSGITLGVVVLALGGFRRERRAG